MFTKWFGTRSSRRPAQENHFRPQLEQLEGRLAPSSMGMGGDNDNGQGNNNNQGGTPGHVNNNDNNHINIHINDHDNFNIQEDNSFNVVINNLTVNGFFTTFGMSTLQLEQQLFSNIGQGLSSTPGASVGDAITLVTDEFQLGQDTGMLLQGILSGGTVSQSLLTTIHNLQTAIQSNILETSAAGQLAGNFAFDIGLQASLPQLLGHS